MSAKSKNEQPQEMITAETKFNLILGGKTYTLNFGTASFMRLMSENPKITNPLSFLDEVSMLEAIPLLIQSAIRPEQRSWKTTDDLFDLFDDCEDPAISKVVPAYISAAGTSAKKLNPAVEAVNDLMERNGKK